MHCPVSNLITLGKVDSPNANKTYNNIHKTHLVSFFYTPLPDLLPKKGITASQGLHQHKVNTNLSKYLSYYSADTHEYVIYTLSMNSTLQSGFILLHYQCKARLFK